MKLRLFIAVLVVVVLVASIMAGFSDGGDHVLGSWWEGP